MLKKLCYLLLLMPLAALATPLDLYEAVVAVEDPSDAVREQATKRAMQEVIAKLSGQRIAPTQAKQIVTNAIDYVQKFAYRTDDDGQRSLWVQFDRAPLNQALADTGLSTSGVQRATTLAWLAIKQDDKYRLMGTHDPSNIPKALIKRAAAWSIPVLLPLLDLEDQSLLGVKDIEFVAREKIMQASERYGADSVITGVTTSNPDGGWKMFWSVYVGNSERRWETQGDKLSTVVSEGVDELARLLVHEFPNANAAVTPVTTTSGAKAVELTINGVTDASQFSRLETYLRSLSAVKELKVLELSPPDRVRYYIVAPGRTHQVLQSIADGNTLRPSPNNAGEYQLATGY